MIHGLPARPPFCIPKILSWPWDKVASNQGCAGVDGETIHAFGLQKQRKLPQLLLRVAEGALSPNAATAAVHPQKVWGLARVGSFPRSLTVSFSRPCCRVLHPLMEAEFEPQSFAYRPGRSHKLAVERVVHWHGRGYDWVLDADIVQYFDTLQHQRLLAEVKERINQTLAAGLAGGMDYRWHFDPGRNFAAHLRSPPGVSPFRPCWRMCIWTTSTNCSPRQATSWCATRMTLWC